MLIVSASSISEYLQIDRAPYLPSSPTVATAISCDSLICFTSTGSKLDNVNPGRDVTVVVPSRVGVRTARPPEPGTEVTEKVARELLEIAWESRTWARAVAVAHVVPFPKDESACNVVVSPRSMALSSRRVLNFTGSELIVRCFGRKWSSTPIFRGGLGVFALSSWPLNGCRTSNEIYHPRRKHSKCPG